MTESIVRCKACSTELKAQIYSAGMSDVVVFTCDRDSTVLTISTWNRTLHKKLDLILGSSRGTPWNKKQFRLVEAQLKPCSCGGKFKHDVMPKCPNCGEVLRVKSRGASWFWVVDKMLDGDKQNPWREDIANPDRLGET